MSIEDAVYIVTFGKYKGKEISEVPSSYLDWCLETFKEEDDRVQERAGESEKGGSS